MEDWDINKRMEFKNYSKTEVQELVKMVHMGAMIRSSVAESQGQDWKKLESFEQKIYQSICSQSPWLLD